MSKSIHVSNEGYYNPNIIISKSYECYLKDIDNNVYYNPLEGHSVVNLI